MEWLVYILLGLVIIQQIQIIFLNKSNQKFLEFMKSQTNINLDVYDNFDKTITIFENILGIRADNTSYNEEGNGSINPSEADTGLCHEVSRQK